MSPEQNQDDNPVLSNDPNGISEAPDRPASSLPGQAVLQNSFQPSNPIVVSADTGPPEPPVRKRRRWVVAAVVLLVIILLVAAGWVAIHKKGSNYKTATSNKASPTSTTIHIPADWKKVDTGFGFSVRVPGAWSTLGPSASPRLFAGDHRQDIYIGPNEDSEATPKLSDTEQSIAVGTEKIDGITTEAAFNAKILSVLKEGQSETAGQGANPNESTTTSKT
ncbi:MAG TPA: hypothetical protein VHC21_02735 [Candidatus Saccharimonadales bacterium]|nr:hypothetical protein [Candidatus Saccharimonadales bacterium]